MAIKTPQQYLDSLRDGRVVYFDGKPTVAYFNRENPEQGIRVPKGARGRREFRGCGAAGRGQASHLSRWAWGERYGTFAAPPQPAAGGGDPS